MRAPTLVHWKGRIAPGKNTTLIISAQDALPTLAELAGATDYVPADITGISYARVLFGKPAGRLHEYHYWEWALWDWNKSAEVPGGLMQGLRKENWKIARTRSDQPWELYDLVTDIGERKNLAKDRPEKLAELVKLAEKARTPMRPQQEPEHPAGEQFN